MNSPAKHRILLIDTDSAFLSKVFDVLIMGYEVVVRNDSVSALNKLHRYEPDVIVLETDLPEIDGFELARMLRRRIEHRTVPVVFLAHRMDETKRRMAGMVGAMLAIDKTEPLGRIAASISRMIQGIPVPVREKQLSLREIYDEQHDEALREIQHPREPIHHHERSWKSAPTPPPSPEPPPEPTPEPKKPLQEAPPAPPPKAEMEADDSDTLLPMGPKHPPRTPRPQAAPKPPARPRVLLAHHDPEYLAKLTDALARRCDCIATTSGLEAVDKAGRYRPDLIVTDMRLSGMPGFEVSQTLRSDGHFANTPIMGTVDTDDKLRHNDIWRYGITRLFIMPEDRDKLVVEIFDFADSDLFHPHDYPQPFTEVVAEEEEVRLKRAQLRARIQEAKENKQFRQLFVDEQK